GFDHAIEVLGRLGVHRLVVGVDLRVEVDLGLGNVQEAVWLALGAFARLRAREHVIGRRQNLGGAVGLGAQRRKRLDERQRLPGWLGIGGSSRRRRQGQYLLTSR